TKDREPDAQITVFSNPRLLAPVRAFVASLAERTGFEELLCCQISLAVDEAVANIINHGYRRRHDGRIWIYAWVLEAAAPGLCIVLDDLGNQVDPQSIKGRDLDDIRPGGLGVHIIREIMDRCAYERRSPGGMRLTLVKYLPQHGGLSGGPAPSSGDQSKPVADPHARTQP
ncbi:MAG: ATP-binding protein, partial [Phycisphaerales bacterium]|nr:ATP-binding protein [Phycisphaerales bacterium]